MTDKSEIIADVHTPSLPVSKIHPMMKRAVQIAAGLDVTTAANWPEGSPTTIQAAIDTLAARSLVSDVTLTAAQVKTLNGTPVSIIAAPGAGKYIQVEQIEILPTGTVGYDGVASGEDLVFFHETGSTLITFETTGWLDQNTPALRTALPAVASITALTNKALIAQILSAEVFAAAGNHGLKIRVRYKIHTALT